VTTQIDRNRLISAPGDGGGRPAPGPPGLPTTVQENHRARRRITVAIGDDADATRPLGGERLGFDGHQWRS
jgi:hypothetical protein